MFNSVANINIKMLNGLIILSDLLMKIWYMISLIIKTTQSQNIEYNRSLQLQF